MLILISIFHLGAKSALEWSPINTKAAEQNKNWPCDKMLLEMQSKHVTYNLPKNKKQCTFCAQHVVTRLEASSVLLSEIISSLSLLIQTSRCPVSLCFLTALFRWVVHCSQSHVYWPNPQCEIQNNCSPQLPWHSLAHCSGLFSLSRKSNWDRISPQKKSSQCYVFPFFSPRHFMLKKKKSENDLQIVFVMNAAG